MRTTRAGRKSLPTIAVASLVSVSACDLLAPTPDLTLTLETREIRVTRASYEEPPPIDCDLRLRGVVDGEPDARAAWDSARIDAYVGTVRDTPVAQLTLSARDMSRVFGADELEPGAELGGRLRLRAGVPFYGILSQRYQVLGGRSKVAELGFECGASEEVGPPPRVGSLDPPALPPEPGWEYILTYSVSASMGVWGVELELAGAWSAVDTIDLGRRLGDTLVEGTIEILKVPLDAPMGEVLRGRLIVRDAAWQTTVGSYRDLGTISDLGAPKLITGGWGTPVAVNPLHPVAAGDTVILKVESRDASPHWVGFGVGEPELFRDSVPVPPGRQNSGIAFAALPEWEGRQPVHVWAVDTLGQRSDSLFHDWIDDLLVYPSSTPAVDSLTVAGPVTDLRIDGRRSVIYLARPDTPAVVRLSATDLRPLAPIPLVSPAASLDLSVSGDSLIVALADTPVVTVVDLENAWRASGEGLNGLGQGFLPQAVRVGPRGEWLIQAMGEPAVEDNGATLEWDPATGQDSVLARESIGDEWSRVLRSDDRSYMAAITEAGLRRYRDGGLDPTWWAYNLLEFATDGAGTLLASRVRLYDAAGDVVHRYSPIRRDGYAAELSPDGSRLLKSTERGLHIISVADWQPLEFLRVPLPSGRMQVSPDGTFVVVWGGDEIGPSVESTRLVRVPLTP